MNDAVIKLHPKNYKEILSGIIFYINEQKVSQEMYDAIFRELQNAKTLVVTSYKKNASSERRYSLYVGHYVLNFFGSEYTNLQCTSILFGKKAAEKKESLYKTKIFTIIPSGGVYVIYNGEIHPEVADNSWKMDMDVYNDLLDSMDEYFEADDADDEADEKKERTVIPERFRNNILRPFRDYTDKESWVEQYRQTQGEGIEYFRRAFLRKNDKGSIYGFYSQDENADPEKGFFAIGDRITIVGGKDAERGIYTGVLEEIDHESDEAVIFMIAFYHQADDADFPDTGRLVMAINDTQTKVRSRVIRSMERGKVESQYMYRTFADFSVAGYEEVPDDLKEYLAEKMAGKYPPNQMQLEAIIKGILTEDLLLVLGPPGTGKTTVISFWVEYFIRKGQRVLISSQNNAAVDNVLARFGKIAETVRLGNENKVQENCKPYLPQNKIESMQLHFNENHLRVESDMAHNKEELRKYRERLKAYQMQCDVFQEKSKKLAEYTGIMQERMKDIGSLYDEVCFLGSEIDRIMEGRAHQEIFLRVYETKGFLEKLLRKRYATRVRRELESGVEALRSCRGKYAEAIHAYNQAVGVLRMENERLRAQKIVSEYDRTLELVTEYTHQACTREFLPQFVGEMAGLFTQPEFVSSWERNMDIVAKQQLVLDKLEKSIRKMEVALQEWNTLVNNQRNDIMQNALLETCQIVGATCIGINSNRDFANVKFDVAIVDESGQIQIHNALVPMSRAKKNLLLGDYKQIPPCANEEVVVACKADEIKTDLLNMSFFEYVFESMRRKTIITLEKQGMDKSTILKPVLEDYSPKPFQKFEPEVVQNMITRVTKDPKKLVNLNRQFRMPGNISDIISEWFYEGNYFSSYNMDNFAPMVPGTEKPLVVISTSQAQDRSESQPASRMGYQNAYEAQLIADLVSRVIEAQPENERQSFLEKIEDQIGIISAYGAQVRLIREYLSKKKLPIKESQIRSMVASLDSFQGQERPLILYSLTRSTVSKKPENGRVGFMKELRRLNVAFTRCQKQLVIAGDIDYLVRCMNMEQHVEEGEAWPCENREEPKTITGEVIEQCSECSAACERKFARFMRLLLQHVNEGAGDLLSSSEFLRQRSV
ncbi:MAG: AAA domain-containing protein [Acetatifactor sp.]